MFTPFVIFGLLRAGAFFSCGATLTNRTGPVGPNQHTFPTAAMCRTEAAGAGRRIYYRWPKATMRRQGRREMPACEVYPNRRRAFWAPLTAPWSGQGQARVAGAVRAPRTRSVRGAGSHARVGPAARAMPGTYSYVSPPLMPFSSLHEIFTHAAADVPYSPL